MKQLCRTSKVHAAASVAACLSLYAVKGHAATNDFKGTTDAPGAIAALPWGEAPEEYIVQPGDTMHDICREVVNADFYWPKLWSQNPDVRNPHVIYPGRKLRFFPGEDNEPFFVEVKEDVDIVPIEQNNVTDSTFVNEQIPPKINLGDQVQVDRFSVEVLTNADLGKIPDVPPDYLEAFGFAQVPANIAVQLPGRLSQDKIVEKGTVALGVGDERLLTAAQLYVIDTDEEMPIGKVVTAFRDYENLSGDEVDGSSRLYQYIATLVVTEKLNDSDRVLARVTDIRGNPPRAGDFVTDQWVPYRSVPSNLLSAPRASSGYGEIVRFEFDDQRFGAEGKFAYLIGKNLEKGKNYPIFQKKIGREDKIAVLQASQESASYRGQIYVVETTGEEAIGIIGETREGEVTVGDHLGIRTQAAE